MVDQPGETVESLIAHLRAMDPKEQLQYMVLDSKGALALMELTDGQVDLMKLFKAFKKPMKLAAAAPTPEVAKFVLGDDSVTVHKRQDGRYAVRVNGVARIPECTASEAFAELSRYQQQGHARD